MPSGTSSLPLTLQRPSRKLTPSFFSASTLIELFLPTSTAWPDQGLSLIENSTLCLLTKNGSPLERIFSCAFRKDRYPSQSCSSSRDCGGVATAGSLGTRRPVTELGARAGGKLSEGIPEVRIGLDAAREPAPDQASSELVLEERQVAYGGLERRAPCWERRRWDSSSIPAPGGHHGDSVRAFRVRLGPCSGRALRERLRADQPGLGREVRRPRLPRVHRQRGRLPARRRL